LHLVKGVGRTKDSRAGWKKRSIGKKKTELERPTPGTIRNGWAKIMHFCGEGSDLETKQFLWGV